MSNKVCPKCGTINDAQMNFCSNCGQPLPSVNAAGFPSQEPPPTVFGGATPPSPFGQNQQNAPFNPSGAPYQQPSPQYAVPQQQSPQQQQPPKKSSKGLIFGAIGCLGLLLFAGIGLVIVGYLFSNGTHTANTSDNSNTYVANSSNTKLSNAASNTATDDATSTNLLLSILKARPKLGAFNQTNAKSVVTADYFPEGTGAAQAMYADGAKIVFLTVGQFASTDASKSNFESQIRGIKSAGGKVTYQNTAADGTISALYENKGYFFAEYCNPNKFCNRIHTNNRAALKDFLDAYAK